MLKDKLFSYTIKLLVQTKKYIMNSQDKTK